MPRARALAVATVVVSLGLNAGSGSAEAGKGDAFAAEVGRHFKVWDKDKDGTLSKTEVDAAAADPKVKGQAAAAVVAIKGAWKKAEFKVPPLTFAAIKALADEPKATDKPDFAGTYASALGRIKRVESHELFGPSGPRLETIHQGRMGNCFCLAPLGALVARNPGDVVKMFDKQADGNYKVTLGGKTVEVAPPTDAELAMSSSNEKDGIWVNMYEKAAGEAANARRSDSKKVDLSLDAIAKGGSAGTMLSTITGHKIRRFSCGSATNAKLSEADRAKKYDEVRGLLREATADKRLMTAGTTKPTTPGVTPNHAYAVLGYDAKRDVLTVWNPHGGNFQPKGKPGIKTGYPHKDGVFSIPLDDFLHQFAGLAFELRP